MKIFSGFPSGKIAVTPIPNQFFSELAPAIDDLAELKTTLHILWQIANSKAPCIRSDQLRADRTLMQALVRDGKNAQEELDRSLAAATARGTLLKLTSDVDYYFVNNQTGRLAHEKMEQEKPPLRSTIAEPADVRERPNIFTLYEQNIGHLRPLIVDALKEAEKEYPADWIQEAFKIAVEKNKRNWDNIARTLERWQTEGRHAESQRPKTWWEGEHAKHINR